MKTIWDWLEIGYTTDKQVIKKAYANQAKKYHPEENPEEFKQLRSAYKTAMKYASASKPLQSSVVINQTVAAIKESDGKPLEADEKSVAANEEFAEADEQSAEENENAAKVKELLAGAGKRQPVGENLQDKESNPLPLEAYFQDKGSRQPEPEAAEQTEEYTYNLDGDEESSGGRYQEKEQEEQQGKRQSEQHFVYSHEAFDPAMRGRLLDFLRRMDIIYVDNFMCDSISAWKMLFHYYEYKSDFKNHDFVAAVVDALEQMPKINKKIRIYIGRQLFDSNDDDVKMRYLKERYYNQQSYRRKPDIRQQQKKPQLRDIACKLYGRQSKAYKKYNLINNCIALVSICFFGILMAQAFSISHNDDNEKPKMTISTEFLNGTQGDIVVLEKIEVYKKRYTKDEPFISDVSGDGYADRVYYDSDTDQFLVEEYDPNTSDYIQVGNVDDYCKQNIKARLKLFRFLQEDK